MEDPAARRPTPRSRRGDAVAAVVLASATVAIRLAQASKTPYTVDSDLFALATQRYDPLALRPHPPGYPVFVAIGKALLHLAGGDPNRAFVLQAALWSGVAVAALYGLARAWAGPRPALAAALLFMAAPTFWFNGTVALSYTAECAAMLGVGLAAWVVWRRPSPPRLMALGAAWGLAVGLRQGLFLFLAPVVVLAVAGATWPLDLRALSARLAWVAAAAATVAASWFVPMLRIVGWTAFRHASAHQARFVVSADAVWVRGWGALPDHVARLGYFLHWESNLLLLALGIAAVGWVVARRDRPALSSLPAVPPALPRGAGVFLVAWLGPALVFYLLVFDGWNRGPLGYVLSVLPGLYLVAVLLADHGLLQVAAAVPKGWRRGAAILAAVVLLLPLPGLATDSLHLVDGEAHAHDAWSAQWQDLPSRFPPNDTAILTWQSWAHVEWSFPAYQSWVYFPSYDVPGQPVWAMVFGMQHREQEGRFIEMYEQGPGRPAHPIPATIHTIVLFDFQLAGENGEARRLDPAVNVTEDHLADGWRILILHPDAAHPTVESLFTPVALGQGARGG